MIVDRRSFPNMDGDLYGSEEIIFFPCKWVDSVVEKRELLDNDHHLQSFNDSDEESLV